MGSSTDSNTASRLGLAVVAGLTGAVVYWITSERLLDLPTTSKTAALVILFGLVPVFLATVVQFGLERENPTSGPRALIVGTAGMAYPAIHILVLNSWLGGTVLLLSGLGILAVAVFVLSRTLEWVSSRVAPLETGQIRHILTAVLALSVLLAGMSIQQEYVAEDPCDDTGTQFHPMTGSTVPSPVPIPEFEYAWTNGSLTITHVAGETVRASTLYVEAGNSSVAWSRLSTGDGTITAGDSITVSFVRRDEPVRLVYRGECEAAIVERTPRSSA